MSGQEVNRVLTKVKVLFGQDRDCDITLKAVIFAS